MVETISQKCFVRRIYHRTISTHIRLVSRAEDWVEQLYRCTIISVEGVMGKAEILVLMRIDES